MNKLLAPILMLAALAGCASAPEQPDQLAQNLAALRQRSDQLVDAYNVRHGLHLAHPVVRVGVVKRPPSMAETVCKAHAPITCIITINPHVVWYELEHGLTNTMPHEDAHAICAMLMVDCGEDAHGPAWKAIALELGLDPNDSSIREVP